MFVNIIMGDKCTETAAKTKHQKPKPNAVSSDDGSIIKSKYKMSVEKKIETNEQTNKRE